MAVNGLANPIVPQSHGEVSDFEGKVGKSNVSYDTLRVQDPMVNLSPTANHSFNIVGHTNYIDRVIAAEESALDIFLKDSQSNVDIPQSYLDRITHELGIIREDNSEHMAEVKRQDAKVKDQEFKDNDVEAIEARAMEKQFLETRAQESRVAARLLAAESVEQNIANKAINDQAIKDVIDTRAMGNQIRGEALSEKILEEEMSENQATEKIFEARDTEKIDTDEVAQRNLDKQIILEQRTQAILDSRASEGQSMGESVGEKLVEAEMLEENTVIKYVESREQIAEVKQVQDAEVKVEQLRVVQEKVIEAQSIKDKSAGIEYTEDAIIVEENSADSASMIAAINAENIREVEMQEENPEMLQMSFGVNLLV